MTYNTTLIGKQSLIVQIIIYSVIAFIAYRIYLAINNYFKNLKQSGNYTNVVTNAQTSLTSLASQGIKPAYSQADFGAMANSLEQTFTGCGLGYTDVVKPTFEKLKNDADVYALIQNYGVRKFDECGWGTFNGDLSSALSYKLSGISLGMCGSYNNCNMSDINETLRKNGITFQF